MDRKTDMLFSVIKLLLKNSDVAFAQHKYCRSFEQTIIKMGEYARYAIQGNLNEYSPLHGYDGGNADLPKHRLFGNEKLPVRSWCPLWPMQPNRFGFANALFR